MKFDQKLPKLSLYRMACFFLGAKIIHSFFDIGLIHFFALTYLSSQLVFFIFFVDPFDSCFRFWYRFFSEENKPSKKAPSLCLSPLGQSLCRLSASIGNLSNLIKEPDVPLPCNKRPEYVSITPQPVKVDPANKDIEDFISEVFDKLKEKGVEFSNQELIKESVKKDPKLYYELNQRMVDEMIGVLDMSDARERQMVFRIKEIFGLLVPNGGSEMEKSESRGAFSLVKN